jgi:site-specific DNA-methyltransferase (adenine-specific)
LLQLFINISKLNIDDVRTPYGAHTLKYPSHPHAETGRVNTQFVLASSNEGDLVIGPFSGSGTTIVVAEQLGRLWMGCDLDSQYNQWAIKRLENVRRMTKDEC